MFLWGGGVRVRAGGFSRLLSQERELQLDFDEDNWENSAATRLVANCSVLFVLLIF